MALQPRSRLIGRLLLVTPAAALVTAGLFAFLVGALLMGEPALSPESDARIVLFREIVEEPKFKTPDRPRPPEPVPEIATPPTPRPAPFATPQRRNGTSALAAPANRFMPAQPNLALPSLDGSVPVALIKTRPIYPQTLANRGIEGYVTVAFDISPDGRVIAPYVVASEPPVLFDRAALNAIRKWRYRAVIVDGEPVPRTGNRATIEFTLPSTGRSTD